MCGTYLCVYLEIRVGKHYVPCCGALARIVGLGGWSLLDVHAEYRMFDCCIVVNCVFCTWCNSPVLPLIGRGVAEDLVVSPETWVRGGRYGS